MATFRAMTTDVTVLSPTVSEEEEAAIAREVAALFERMEQTFSRFRDDSELSRLNRAEGPFRASAELASATARALMYETLTGGLFDAHVGAAMIDNGYDKSFAPGPSTGPTPPAAPLPSPPHRRPRPAARSTSAPAASPVRARFASISAA